MEVNADTLLRKIGQLTVSLDMVLEENTNLKQLLDGALKKIEDSKKPKTTKKAKK